MSQGFLKDFSRISIPGLSWPGPPLETDGFQKDFNSKSKISDARRPLPVHPGLDREKPGIEKLPVSIKSLLHLIETNKNSTALQFQDILLSL